MNSRAIDCEITAMLFVIFSCSLWSIVCLTHDPRTCNGNADKSYQCAAGILVVAVCTLLKFTLVYHPPEHTPQ